MHICTHTHVDAHGGGHQAPARSVSDKHAAHDTNRIARAEVCMYLCMHILCKSMHVGIDIYDS